MGKQEHFLFRSSLMNDASDKVRNDTVRHESPAKEKAACLHHAVLGRISTRTASRPAAITARVAIELASNRRIAALYDSFHPHIRRGRVAQSFACIFRRAAVDRNWPNRSRAGGC